MYQDRGGWPLDTKTDDRAVPGRREERCRVPTPCSRRAQPTAHPAGRAQACPYAPILTSCLSGWDVDGEGQVVFPDVADLADLAIRCHLLPNPVVRSGPMSVRMTKPESLENAPERTTAWAIEVARGFVTDPRLAEVVPGFDAPFFQAGLAGYSDGAMRLVARDKGCPYCITEALLDLTLINGGKGRRKEDPDLIATECGMGEIQENSAFGLDDHPLAGQIMGTRPETMAEGAAILVGMGYDVIDVNLACPVKKIRKQHRGGHFLAFPDEAIAVLKAVRDAVPKEIPCTVKLRRAFDDTDEQAANFERIFDAVYESGYAWATVHCRTVKQKYIGPGRWSFLQDLVKRHPDRVILGSGDIWCVQDIFAMLMHCGVHGVSVARGCIGNPWIFRQARQILAGQEPTTPSLAEQTEVLLRHHHLSTVIHGEARASRMMRKFGIKFAVHHPEPDCVKGEFIKCSSSSDWVEVLRRHYDPSIESILPA